MINCKECRDYAKLIFSRGEIPEDEIEKVTLDRHILKGCNKPLLDESNVIRLKQTSAEFRKGFMSAMNCVLDMGKGEHTYNSLLGVIESIVALNNKGELFPGSCIDDGSK